MSTQAKKAKKVDATPVFVIQGASLGEDGNAQQDRWQGLRQASHEETQIFTMAVVEDQIRQALVSLRPLLTLLPHVAGVAEVKFVANVIDEMGVPREIEVEPIDVVF